MTAVLGQVSALCVRSYKRPESLRRFMSLTEAGIFDVVIFASSGCEYEDLSRSDVPEAWASIVHLRAPDRVRWGCGEAANRAVTAAYRAMPEHEPAPAFVLLCDDDYVPLPGTVRRLFEVLRGDPSIGIVSPATDAVTHRILAKLRDDTDALTSAAFLPRRCLAMTGAVIEKIGCHDPAFLQSSGVDYLVRATMAGFHPRTAFCHQAPPGPKNDEPVGVYATSKHGGVALHRGAEQEAMRQLFLSHYPWARVSRDFRYEWRTHVGDVPLDERVKYARRVEGIPTP